MTWLVAAWYLLLGTLVLGFFALIASLANSREPRRRLLRVGTPVVVVVALGTTAYGLYEAAMPTVTPVTVTSRELPEGFDGLQVALVTDLHVGPVRDVLHAAGRRRGQRPARRRRARRRPRRRTRQPGRRRARTARRAQGPARGLRRQQQPRVHLTGGRRWLTHWESLGITVLRNENVALRRQSTRSASPACTTRPARAPMPPMSTAPSAARPRPASRSSRRTSPGRLSRRRPRHRPAALRAHTAGRCGRSGMPCGSSSRSSTVSAWSATYRC